MTSSIGSTYSYITKMLLQKLPVVQYKQSCDFDSYNADMLMKETVKLGRLITRRGTLEILIPLCCTANPVRYLKFRNILKGFSSKTKT
jgi:hypothetical protein